MSNLKKLQSAKSINELADLLGYKAKTLAYILYKIPNEDRYTISHIPKKNGGYRVIHAPNPKLKLVQRKLASLLYDCIEEVKPKTEKIEQFNGTKPRRDRAKKSVSHGFQKGLSIASNAEEHLKKKYVYNIDIENFFPSINFGRVRGFFIKNIRFRLDPKVATIIAQIACHDNSLPQGSPCSPVISNLIAEIMDAHLVGLAKRHGCKYTRYADDLTFSTNLKKFPKQIAYRKFLKKNQWRVGKKLEYIVHSSGYSINHSKSNMQFSDSRQIVTGLTVNRVVNTRSEYYRYTRSMCHSLFKTGAYVFPENLSKLPKKREKTINRWWSHYLSKHELMRKAVLIFKKQSNSYAESQAVGVTGSLKQLEGMLGHIYYIKNYRNKFAQSGYRASRHDGNLQPKQDHHENKYPPFNRCNNYTDESHLVAVDGIKNLYAKFLFFKHFYFLEKPLIFCEGKTDNIYIKCAIKELAALYPELADSSSGVELKLNFFNRTPLVNEMLKLAGGTGGMKFIIQGYKRNIEKYKCDGKKHPVIMIVDDDNEGRKVKAECKNFLSGKTVSSAIHVHENLFLIELPPAPGKKQTEMEDYFENTVLETKLSGKSFNRKNDSADNKNEYGKSHFANYVVNKNRSKINFDGFKPLLDEIKAVIQAHPI